jgi:hypothetical protein
MRESGMADQELARRMADQEICPTKREMRSLLGEWQIRSLL